MNLLTPHHLSLFFLALLAFFYIPAIIMPLRRRVGQESTVYFFSLFALVSFLLQVYQFLVTAGLSPIIDSAGYERIALYGMLLLALLLIFVLDAFLRLKKLPIWLAIASAWLLILFLLEINAFQLPDPVWTDGRIMLPLDRLVIGAILIEWMLFLMIAMLITRRVYQRTPQPLHRNRILFWVPIFILLLANDALLISNIHWSNVLRLLAVLLLSYTISTHHLPDSRTIIRQVLIYMITTVLIVLFYIAGTALSQVVFQTNPDYDPRVAGAAVALLLALIFAPLLGFIQQIVDRLLFKEDYDAAQTLQAYSQNISNILEMERLATIAVGIIIEALQIQRGFLFLVDQETNQNGDVYYRLRNIRTEGETAPLSGNLALSSPVAMHVTEKQRPLLQYDVDLLPAYKKVHSVERRWLESLHTEVYVPIFSKKEWIGMFALGAKLSGNRYTEEDLTMLSTVANQTAVALENARLVENLVRLNNELRTAYRALGQAKRHLEKLDRTKSDFISIASHELRTPLTVMRGYTEMLLDDPEIAKNAYHLQTLKGTHKSVLRMHEIMESMFDITLIDTRSLQLHVQKIDTAELIREVCTSLADAIRERRQFLQVSIPEIPTIFADLNALQKVFQHLITNAIKFTPDEGKIHITASPSKANAEMPHGGIEIIISDTGVGVDPQYRDLIFTKFYQTSDLNRHSTGKTKFKGSGMGVGLALARGILEAHGGRIWVESPGYDDTRFPGSQFHLAMPFTSQEQREQAVPGNPINIQIGD